MRKLHLLKSTVRYFPALFFLSIAVAAYLRFPTLEKAFLLFDERRELEWMLDPRSLQAVLHDLFSLDTLPYHWFFYLFSYLYGRLVVVDSLTMIRLPAFLFGMAGIVAGFVCVKRIFNERAALIFVSLLVFHHMHIKYSVRMRHYSLGYLCVILSIYFFWSCLREDSARNRAYLAVTNVIMFLALPVTGLLTLLEYIFIIWHGLFVKSRDPERTGTMLFLTKFEFLLYTLAGASLYKMAYLLLVKKEYGNVPNNYATWDALRQGYDSLLLFYGRPISSTPALLLLLAVCAFYFLRVFIFPDKELREGCDNVNLASADFDRNYLLLAMFAAVVFIPFLFFLFCRNGVQYQWRYTSYCFIPALIILSYLISRASISVQIALPLFVCSSSLILFLNSNAHSQKQSAPRFKKMGMVVIEHFAGTEFPVYTIGGSDEWTRNINAYHRFLDLRDNKTSAWRIYSDDNWPSFLAHLDRTTPRRFSIVRKGLGDMREDLEAIVGSCKLENQRVKDTGGYVVHVKCGELQDVYPKLMFLSK